MKTSKTAVLLLLSSLIIYWTQAADTGITPTASRVSETLITNTAGSLQNKVCNCNVNADVCDNYCCCDPVCTADVIAGWKRNNQCTNKDFIYSLSAIPLCSKARPKTLEDLQAGLRIYYQILKILFCVVFDNSETTDLYKDFQSQDNINKAIAVSTPVTSIQTTGNVYVEQQSAANGAFTKLTIPRMGFGGSQCSSQTVSFGVNIYALIYSLNYDTRSIWNHKNVSLSSKLPLATYCASGNQFADPTRYANLAFRKTSGTTSVTRTVNVFSRTPTSISGYTPTNNDLASAPVYSATLCSCSNFVSEVNYRFQVNANNEIQKATLDLVITDQEIFGNCSLPVIVKQKTSFTFSNVDSNYTKLKGPGYRIGDSVPIGNINTTTSVFDLFTEPLSFSFVNRDGLCVLVGAQIDPKFSSSIKFGYQHAFSCVLDQAQTANVCANPAIVQMYANIYNNIGYLAQFPNANPVFTSDWVEVTPKSALPQATSSSSCSFSIPVFSIFYTAVGSQDNPGFKINSAKIAFNSNEEITITAGQQATLKLYVDFVKLPQVADLFVAPIPTARLSLPDNVLIPFITKS